MVTAKVRDIDRVGTIVDAVAKAGGDITRIDSVDFSVDDPSDYYEEVREKAMADAKGKAEQLARLAGVRLGKAIFVAESTQIPIIRERAVAYAEAMPAPAIETSISPGEMEVSLTIQVAYAIIN